MLATRVVSEWAEIDDQGDTNSSYRVCYPSAGLSSGGGGSLGGGGGGGALVSECLDPPLLRDLCLL